MVATQGPSTILNGIKKISENLWEVPANYREGMKVPAWIYASEKLLKEMDAAVFDQVTHVAMLPGIVKYAICMPDGHSGYGFPIGGVAAMDARTGVISPGGIGFDINCGMRLVRTSLTYSEVEPHLHELVNRLYEQVPAGVGSTGSIRLDEQGFRDLAERGSRWALEHGYAWKEDLELTEDGGCALGADSQQVSEAAIQRGLKQIGTLGSGNHYLEIQVVRPENVFDAKAARVMGIDRPNQVMIMFHCGSRGFGHQVASDYLKLFLGVMEKKYGLKVLDRELACAPFQSPEGQAYFAAMKCAINVSFANRQVILHQIRKVFSQVFQKSPEQLGLHMVYDVAHNTAKLERHRINGQERELLVHRKGATRAFAPGMEGVPARYREIGQPVLIGGSMESGSYVLLGTQEGAQSFFSTAHGSGRVMSRTQAKKTFQGKELAQRMAERGIYVRAVSYSGLAEEAGKAYKNIDEVIAVTRDAGMSRPVVKLIPIGNIKG